MINFTLLARTETEIKKRIEDYYDNYPSQGYGTSIAPPVFNELDKSWSATGSRAASCD